MSGVVLILGATSAIAVATARAFAQRGYDLYVAGRDVAELERLASDIRLRYQCQVHCRSFDADQLSEHAAFVAACQQDLEHSQQSLAGVVLAFGYLGDQQQGQHDPAEAQAIVRRNFSAAVSLLEPCAAWLEQQQQGFLTIISSVAGERGRQSNYLYGAAKGGLSLYAQGLRNRLFRAGVSVTTVKPGFVDTAMTYGKEGMFLLAQPEQVAKQIVQGSLRRQSVLYTPWFWRYIMLIIRSVPEILFKRLSL